jgi:nicotinamidase-related amidase
MPFLKPVTVTAAGLEAETRRKQGALSVLGWRTSNLGTVLRKLAAFEATPNPRTEGELMAAVVTWKTKHPHEFANRDKLSGGMCTKLAIELGVDNLRDDTIRSVTFFGENRPDAKARHVPVAHASRIRVTERMDELLGTGQRLGLVLIDVQAQHIGLENRYDGTTTVLENMQAVLARASVSKIPVMEFWMGHSDGPSKTIPEIRAMLPARRATRRKPTHNAFEGTDLDAWLKRERVKYVVIMGYNANQCVGATVFGGMGRPTAQGTPYIPGLLDRGYHVLTSRSILASGDAPLAASEGWPYIGPCQRI